MPVQLSNGALGQVLLSTRNFFAGGQVRDDLFSNPASFQDPRLRVRETPFDIGNNTVIGALLAQIVRILKIEFVVGATYS